MEPYERIGRTRPLLVASAALLALTWIDWWFGRDAVLGVPYPVGVAVLLGVNLVVTARWRSGKRVAVAAFQRWVLNPVVRTLVRLGLPLGWCVLETRGRRTGRARTVPVGHGLVGDGFWVVAEHGVDAGWVRNVEADPRVRVLVRDGLRVVWRTGTAHVLRDDDPYARQRWLVGWTHPLRALNAMVVRVLGTDPVTVRVDLDPVGATAVPDAALGAS